MGKLLFEISHFVCEENVIAETLDDRIYFFQNVDVNFPFEVFSDLFNGAQFARVVVWGRVSAANEGDTIADRSSSFGECLVFQHILG